MALVSSVDRPCGVTIHKAMEASSTGNLSFGFAKTFAAPRCFAALANNPLFKQPLHCCPASRLRKHDSLPTSITTIRSQG